MTTAQMQEIVRRAEAVGARDITTHTYTTPTGKRRCLLGFSVGVQSYPTHSIYKGWDRTLREIEHARKEA